VAIRIRPIRQVSAHIATQVGFSARLSEVSVVSSCVRIVVIDCVARRVERRLGTHTGSVIIRVVVVIAVVRHGVGGMHSVR